MELLNVKTNAVENLPEEQVPQALASGTHQAELDLDVPVISPDGELGSVKGQHLVEALKQGYRFSTPEDVRKIGDDAMAQAAKDVFAEHPATALGAGLLAGGTLGLSNLAVRAAGAGEALQQSKAANPIAYGAGELTGAVASPVVGAIAKGAGDLALGAGEATGILKSGQVAAEAAGPSQALSVGQKVLRGAVDQSAQGATYGLGSGIGEASLGDPNEVAETLLSHVGQGALFGGAIGGATEAAIAAKQPLFDFASTNLGRASDLVSDAARNIANRSMTARLTQKGLEDLNPIAKDLIQQPEFRNEALNNGGLKNFDNVTKEAESAVAQLEKEAAETRRQLVERTRDLPKDARDDINEILQQNRGDIKQSMESSFSDYKRLKGNFDAALESSTEPATIADRLLTDTQDLVQNLRLTAGDPKAVEKAQLLSDVLNAKIPLQIQGLNTARSEILESGFTAGDEIQLANRLRQMIPVKETGLDKFSPEARKAMIEYRKSIDDYALKNHPIAEYATQQRELDRYYNVYKNLENFVMKGPKGAKNVMSPASLIKTIQMPEQAEAFNNILNNFSDFAPAIQKVQDGVNNIKLRLDGINDFQKLMRQKSIDIGPNAFNSSDIQELAKILGPTDKISEGLNKLQSQEGLMNQMSAAANPVEKLMILQKASGNPISKELEAASKSADSYGKLKTIVDKVQAADKSEGKTLGLGVLSYLLSGSKVVGSLVSGAAKLSNGLNPYSTLKTLTMIENTASSAAKNTSKAIELAVNGLTSNSTKKILTAGVAEARPLSEVRKDFKAQADYLANFDNPATVKKILDTKVGTIEHAPQLEAALKAQIQAAGRYLLKQVPRDPLVNNTLFPTKSLWQPSDMDLAKFQRSVEAASNPLNVIGKVANGSVTPEEIQTVSTLYPSIYKQLQSKVYDAMMEHGDDIGYQQKLKLSQLFNVPTDPSLDGQAIANYQSNFGTEKQQASNPATLDNKKPVNVKINTENYSTSTQKVTAS